MPGKFRLFTIGLLITFACTQHSETDEERLSDDALPFTTLSFSNLSEFRDVSQNNWKTASEVYANREEEHHLETHEGNGILLNQPDDNNQANLFTEFEHGDIDLTLDFLMPKGSNSGIYLQGRYEVQLFDSWLKDSVTYEDCGGIYQRWNNERGFEGKAPAINASKAPGLWQHLFIRFKAPKFDESGKKIANARFQEVILNGKVVQREVEISGPTRAAAFEDEKPVGPLMIQGDHGPVAFKNMKYKTYKDQALSLENVTYQIYKGAYTNTDTLESLQPIQSGETDTLSYLVSKENALYTLVFKGEMVVPESGDYLFSVQSGGPSWFHIDNEYITDNDASNNYDHHGYGKRQLEAGQYPFTLTYVNLVPWNKSVTLSYEGPGIPLSPLTTQSSGVIIPNIEPITIKVAEEPVLQRGFMIHHDVTKTHVAAIGFPEKINYAYDLKNYNLLSAWRGEFLNVTEMWLDRGERQLEEPLGAPLEISILPTVALLSRQNAAWPDSVTADDQVYRNRGYRLTDSNIPAFFYTIGDVEVEDTWQPSPNQEGLVRKLNFTFHQSENEVYCLLASGSHIEALPNGSYAVDDKRYYIEDLQGENNQPVIRNERGRAELLIPILPQNNQSQIQYSIIW